ncbi:hypothetical protein TanjilG_32759 [Lupinus angustifolius]|uniref:OVATE domain-containing protein n=1 Tax=Lupinus angustifolius TaxID=3871 RepID=A0A4P1RGE8_LUPAN|nr:PREDICTED: uncharacterized protein LOC109350442 [Lupinus angustifolius]OIW10019.1 hypothetical protein TanjilG_32759 [Lupinus angustifolius]
MLLRSSISNTKKFFQKTLHSFKSLFIAHYQKLPKNPPHNSMAVVSGMDKDSNPSYKDLEKFYSDFTGKWDAEKYHKVRRRSKKKAVLPCTTKQEKEACNESLISMKLNNARNEMKEGGMEKGEECNNDNKKRNLTHQRVRHEDSLFNSMVEKKLRELEKLDQSNVDYVLDIEEVLHYYSRLTCPAYLEIVDKFFMEMYLELEAKFRCNNKVECLVT